MKSLLSLCFSFLFVSVSNAQTRWAVKAGPNYSTAKAVFAGVKQPTDYLPGVNIAVQTYTPFEPPLFFSCLAAYSLRGYKITPLEGSITQYENRIHYLELATLLSFKIKAGATSNIVLSAGPMAGLAIGGKESQTENGSTTKTKMKFSTSENYGVFDLAIYSSAGIHFNKFFIEAAWQHGVVNINNNAEFDFRNIQNRSLSVNLGYYFH
ncbi:MAG: outer membrane beta-barrel protein [Ferruginibacter sp.]